MNSNIFSHLTFWTGLIILLIPTIVTFIVLTKKNRILIGFITSLVLIVAYYYNESKQLINDESLNKIIKNDISRVELLKKYDPTQRIRSNIFLIRKDGYKMIYDYNMDTCADKGITIPINEGVTGLAVNNKRQVIMSRDKIVDSGGHSLPPVENWKIPKDLCWICSTPIKDENGEVIMVLGIDGNRKCDSNFIDIQKFANKLVKDLKVPLHIIEPSIPEE